MRVLLSCLAIFFYGCGNRSYIDLRKPIYFVTEESFFTGCDTDSTGQDACRESRRQKVRDGVAQWFSYFEGDTQPFIGVVSSGRSVPMGLDNAPIYLSVQPKGCDNVVKKTGEKVLACYNTAGFMSDPRITFTAAMPENIAAHVVAHEFGHALGLDHYDNDDGTFAIMSESVPIGGNVVLADIDRLCKKHKECPKRKSAAKDAKRKK